MMLENPRNKEFDVYVLDQVFPEDEHSEFLKLIRELNGDWKKELMILMSSGLLGMRSIEVENI